MITWICDQGTEYLGENWKIQKVKHIFLLLNVLSPPIKHDLIFFLYNKKIIFKYYLIDFCHFTETYSIVLGALRSDNSQ